jgi:hypothetical protein
MVHASLLFISKWNQLNMLSLSHLSPVCMSL